MIVETIVTSAPWSCVAAVAHSMGDAAANIPQGDVTHGEGRRLTCKQIHYTT